MNFKVFARSLFLVVVIATVAFIIYANASNPNESAKNVPQTTQTSVEETTAGSAADGTDSEKNPSASEGNTKSADTTQNADTLSEPARPMSGKIL